MTTPNGNGSASVSLKWLAGILVAVILAMAGYFVQGKDEKDKAHDQAIEGNAARINVLYERVVKLETKLDVANEKLDFLVRTRVKTGG